MPGQLRRSVLLRSSRHTRHSRRAHMDQHEAPEAAAAARHHQQRMDNAGYITENERNKRQVNIPLTETGKGGGVTVVPVEGPSCSPDVCRRARSKYNQEHGEQGPWHRKKTIFLIGTIVLLAVWVVVYAALSKMDML